VPIYSPFDVVSRRQQQGQQPAADPFSSFLESPQVDPSQLETNYQGEQAEALKQQQAAQKAQDAQDKQDAADQAQAQEKQDEVDAKTYAASGAITRPSAYPTASGKTSIRQVPVTDENGNPTYKPGDQGVAYDENGQPWRQIRRADGSWDSVDPFSLGYAKVSIDSQGKAIATPHGKDASTLGTQDVSSNADIYNDPQVADEVQKREQAVVGKTAKEQIENGVVADAETARQAHQDAISAAQQANLDYSSQAADLKNSLDPESQQKLKDLQSARDQARQGVIDAQKAAESKFAEARKAKADPVGYLKSKNQAQQDAIDQSQDNPQVPPLLSPDGQPTVNGPTPDALPDVGQNGAVMASTPPASGPQPGSEPPSPGAAPTPAPVTPSAPTPDQPSSVADGIRNAPMGSGPLGSVTPEDAMGNSSLLSGPMSAPYWQGRINLQTAQGEDASEIPQGLWKNVYNGSKAALLKGVGSVSQGAQTVAGWFAGGGADDSWPRQAMAAVDHAFGTQMTQGADALRSKLYARANQTADAANTVADQLIKTDPNSVAAKVGTMIGAAPVFLDPLMMGVAGVGMGQQQAKAQGATDSQAVTAGLQTGLVDATIGKILGPLGHLSDRLKPVLADGIGGFLAKALGHTAVSSARGSVEMTAFNTANNAIANANAPEKTDVLNGWEDSAITGAIQNALFGAGGMALRQGRNEALRGGLDANKIAGNTAKVLNSISDKFNGIDQSQLDPTQKAAFKAQLIKQLDISPDVAAQVYAHADAGAQAKDAIRSALQDNAASAQGGDASVVESNKKAASSVLDAVDQLHQNTAQIQRMGRTDEGRKQLQIINQYNATLPEGVPKANAVEIGAATSIAPKDTIPTPAHFQAAQEIAAIQDPTQKTAVLAAVKAASGRALTSDETNLLSQVTESNGGKPVAYEQDGKWIFTDAGLNRIREIAPDAAKLLAESEQHQLEAPEPEPAPANQKEKTAKDIETVGKAQQKALGDRVVSDLKNGKINRSEAVERMRNLGFSDEEIDPHIPLNLPVDGGASKEKPSPAEPSSKNPGGANVGDDISFTYPHADKGEVKAKGEVLSKGEDHYEVVDHDSGDRMTVPFSKENINERTPNANSEEHDAGTTDADVKTEPKKEGATKAQEPEEKDAEIPGVSREKVAPEHQDAYDVTAKAYDKYRKLFDYLGVKSKLAKNPDSLGLSVTPGKNVLEVDPEAISHSMKILGGGEDARTRIEAAMGEEAHHLFVERTAQDLAKERGTTTDKIFGGIWKSLSDEQKNAVTKQYGKSLDSQSEANKAREYIRMLTQLEREGRTTEIASLMTPETRDIFQRMVDHLKELLTGKNPIPEAKELLDRTNRLLDAAEKGEPEKVSAAKPEKSLEATEKKPTLESPRKPVAAAKPEPQNGKEAPTKEEDEKSPPPDWAKQGTPRDAATYFEQASHFLKGSGESGEDAHAGSRTDRIASEADRLKDLAEQSGKIIPVDKFRNAPAIPGVSMENAVYHIGDKAWKVTKGKFYGYAPELNEGKGFPVDRVPATPSEYMDRMALANRIFGDHFKFEGVQLDASGHPHMVVSQPWVESAHLMGIVPNIKADEIRSLMQKEGFREIPGERLNPTGWYRPGDGVIVDDLHAGNVVKEPKGKLYPIDTIMGRVDPKEFKDRGWDMTDPRNPEKEGAPKKPPLNWDEEPKRVNAAKPDKESPEFYSQLERTIQDKMPAKASATQIEGILKGGGVKAEEIKWSGLSEWLADHPNPTKAEVLAHVRENGTQINETTLRPPDVGAPHENGNAKYAQYQIPGGENYREKVLSLPTAPDAPDPSEPWTISTRPGNSDAAYKSSHFPEVPNYLAHMRLNDRTDSDGRPGTLIEELQSDRHQQGRERGYTEDAPKEEPEGWSVLPLPSGDHSGRDAGYEYQVLHNGTRMAYARDQNEGLSVAHRLANGGTGHLPIPDAPFRKTWHEHLFRRALADAVANDKDWLGWTTGDTQADRYSLAKQVDNVRAFRRPDGTFDLSAKTKDGSGPHDFGNSIPAEKVSDYIGKDLASKIVNQPDGWHTYEGNDLKVGGEGMKGFYDKILPNYVSKYVKKWGGKVAREDMPIPYEEREDGNIARVSHPIWKVDITPEMRKGVEEGQPVYAAKPESAEEEKPSVHNRIFGDKKGFIEADVKPTIEAVKTSFTSAADDVAKIFAPTLRGDKTDTGITKAQAAGNIIRENNALMARLMDQAHSALKDASKYFDGISINKNLDFMDSIENNRQLADPKLEAIAKTLRQINNQWKEAVRNLPRGSFKNFIENYFPHVWEGGDVDGQSVPAKEFLRRVEGTTAFMKHRTIPTIADGIAMGLKPITYNPVDMMLLRWGQMARYIAAQRILDSLDNEGLAKHFSSDAEAPPGWTRIDKRIGTSEGPTGAYDLTKPGSPPIKGPIPYYAPDSVAQVINNHLSAGLANKGWYKGLVGTANVMNQAQLGFSAFHLGFTSFEASISRFALGVEYAARGNLKDSIKSFISTPLAPLTNVVKGDLLYREWMRQGKGLEATNRLEKGLDKVPGVLVNRPNAELLSSLVDSAIKAGGRVQMDPMYSNHMAKKMSQAFRQGNYVGGILRSPGALLEKVSAPIMEYLVPRQKLGIFADLARMEMQKLGPDASTQQVRQVMGKAWDSVDNRLGQVVYDNLFWNKVTKDISHATIRSVGWNVGDIREGGGGALDWAKFVKDISTGKSKNAEFTHRMAYTIALPTVVMTTGAIVQYLMTGKGPEELKDYFFPKTGDTTPDGHNVRLALPSYMKDVFAVANNPTHTVTSKLHPMWSALAEMMQNKDFYGTEIRHAGDPLVKQVAEELGFVGKNFAPFAVTGGMKLHQSGASPAKQVLPFFGVTPAPAYVDQTPAERIAHQIQQDKMPNRTKTQADFDKNQLKGQLTNLSRQMAKPGISDEDKDDLRKQSEKLLADGTKKGTITPKEVPLIMKEARINSNLSPLQRAFKSMDYDEALKVWEAANKKEKAMIGPMMRHKVISAQNQGRQVDQPIVKELLGQRSPEDLAEAK